MKYLFLLFAAGAFSSGVYAQERYKEKSYQAIVPGKKYNAKTNLTEDTSEPEWSTIIVIDEREGNVFYRYAKSPDIRKMSTTDFYNMPLLRTYRRFKDAKVGVYTIPFRFRGIGSTIRGEQTFDFESTLSLTTNLVFGFGSKYKEESWSDFSVGLGLTSVNLDNSNSWATDNRSASALTLSVGWVIKFNEYVNFGIFAGNDFLGKADRKLKWVYDQQTWLGLGININFNEIRNDARQTDRVRGVNYAGKDYGDKKSKRSTN